MDSRDKSSLALKSLGIDGLSSEDQESLALSMDELIFKDSLARCLEAMTAAGREEFAAFAATNPSPDALADFVSARVPNIDQIVASTIAELSDDILAVTKP